MRSSSFAGFAATSASVLLLAAGQAKAQYNETSKYLTPDGYWHNRYHALLSMAIYGDYDTLCPEQTFTEEAKLSNFPNSNRSAWEVISTFGPTPSGAEGFTAIIPEMNKALIVFKGDYDIEQNLDTDVVGWEAFGHGGACDGCTVNAQAARAYMEAKEETNDWQEILDAYYNQGLVFSITGHGFGGMLSLIASVDMNIQGHCWYSHTYGAPRTFNQDGVDWYNTRFNGEAGERGVAGDDQYTEFIPAGPNYAHAGTTFYYWGLNSSSGNPNWKICWNDEDQTPCAPGAEVQPWDTTPDMDHYFYFSNVGQCGGTTRPIPSLLNDFINSHGQQVDDDNTWQTTSYYGNGGGGSGGGYRTSSSSSRGGGYRSSSSSSSYGGYRTSSSSSYGPRYTSSSSSYGGSGSGPSRAPQGSPPSAPSPPGRSYGYPPSSSSSSRTYTGY